MKHLAYKEILNKLLFIYIYMILQECIKQKSVSVNEDSFLMIKVLRYLILILIRTQDDLQLSVLEFRSVYIHIDFKISIKINTKQASDTDTGSQKCKYNLRQIKKKKIYKTFY